MLHGTGIFTYNCLKSMMVTVGKYSVPWSIWVHVYTKHIPGYSSLAREGLVGIRTKNVTILW